MATGCQYPCVLGWDVGLFEKGNEMMVYVAHREAVVPAQATIFLSKGDMIRSIRYKEYLYKAVENRTYVCIQRPHSNSSSGQLPCSVWQETNEDLPTLIKEKQVQDRQMEIDFQNYWSQNGTSWLVGSLVLLIVFLVILILRRY